MRYGYEYRDEKVKCKDCVGCGRLEDVEFKGIYRCNSYEQYIKKEEKENM